MEITLRQLKTHEEYEACVVLQKETWGEDFIECVPPAILMIGQKIGGVTAGAFDANGKLIGIVFGLTGMMAGRPVHWSHMLAVRKDIRNEGIGQKLKLFQRNLLLQHGIETVYWTYDPLVARNAHLNLNRLGAKISEYIPEMYGEDTGSDLHRGIGMDRFIVRWPITEERVRQAISGQWQPDIQAFNRTPVVNTRLREDGVPTPSTIELPAIQAVRVEIPANIESIQAESLDLAAQWRTTTRRAFLWYLERAYQVEIFYRETASGRCFYGLVKSDK